MLKPRTDYNLFLLIITKEINCANMFSSRKFIISIILLISEVCSQDPVEVINLAKDAECIIPNQNRTRGVCISRKNCFEYQQLFNETDLNVDRLSFIINLDCGFDFEIWKSLVCCPKSGNTYK